MAQTLPSIQGEMLTYQQDGQSAQDGAPVLSSDLAADFPPLKTLNSHPHNLPIQPTPLVGREREVVTVCELLRREETRLVTLSGPGGVGKTRLGVRVAAELSESFVDGTFFVDLAPLRNPALVVPAIAQRLDIREGTGQSLLERLKEGLQQKQALLLLDNFEQVVSAASQVADLLFACPKLKILVTSREVLHVPAEQEFSVPPLALPDPGHLPELAALARSPSVALFLQRARAVKPDFQLTTSNARAVTDICARLDGLPLAIELATARIKLLPPQALLVRLGQRLPILISQERDVPARQRTLRNTIEWSYDLLGAAEQQLFRRLATFVSGCTLEAVEAVCAALDGTDAVASVLDDVGSLIDKSLMQQTEQEGDEPRLVMLETVREYGQECLRKSAREMEATQHAHAAYYLALAEEAAPELWGPQQATWLERLEREHDNLRATLEWFIECGWPGSSREMALRLGGALWQFWIARGLFSEGRTFLEQTLAGSEGVAASVRAKALSAAADLASMQSDDHRAEALNLKSLDLYRQVGDTRGIAFSLSRLAWVATRKRGDFAIARSQIEQSLALYREVGDKDAIAWSLYFLADNAGLQGEYIRGCDLLEKSLKMFRQLGNKRGIATSLKESALWLFVAQGDQAIICARLEESLALFKELGDKDGMAYYYWISGWVALSQGDASTAQERVGHSLALWQEIGNRWFTAWSLGMLGKVAAHREDLVTARDYHERSLEILRESDDKWFTAFCLEELASVVTAQGEVVWAARLWGAAEALRDMVGLPLPPVFRADYERSVAAARTQLGEKAFTAAWAEGRAMTPEQALAAPEQHLILDEPPPQAHPEARTNKPERASIAYPDELTKRQVEVLRLVAQGLTNRQVADQLIISPRTVTTHLDHIYPKLGVNNRVQAVERGRTLGLLADLP